MNVDISKKGNEKEILEVSYGESNFPKFNVHLTIHHMF